MKTEISKYKITIGPSTNASFHVHARRVVHVNLDVCALFLDYDEIDCGDEHALVHVHCVWLLMYINKRRKIMSELRDQSEY